MEPFGIPRVSVAASANPLNHYTIPEDEGAQVVRESSFGAPYYAGTCANWPLVLLVLLVRDARHDALAHPPAAVAVV